MKFLFLPVILFTICGFTPAPAQNTETAPAAQKRMLGFLTPAEQDKVETVHQKVLAQHPELKTEEEALKEKAATAFSPDSNTGDKQAFREAMKTHVEKMRAEMLKEDPSLSPIFDKIDAHRAELRSGAGAK